MNNKTTEYGLVILLLSSSVIYLLEALSLLVFGVNAQELRSFCLIVTMLFFSLALFQMAKTHYLYIIISTLVIGGLWAVSGLRHPNLIPFLKEGSRNFFIECLPYFWIFSYFSKNLAVKDKQPAFFNLLLKIYKIRLVLALLTQSIMFIFPSSNVFEDHMDAANALLVGLVFVTVDNLRKHHRNIRMTILEVMGILYILILGSRGGVMCYASTYLLYFIFANNGKNKSKLILLGLTATFAIYLMLPVIISSFGDSRYVMLFQDGALFHDEQRSLISEIMILNIVQNPWGSGIMADRYILTNSTEIWNVAWAHNIFLELGVDFGYIGIVLGVVYVLYIMINLRIRDNGYLLLVIPLTSSSIIKLLVSSSLWKDPIFWALAGIVITTSYYKKNNYKASYNIKKRDVNILKKEYE